MFFHVLFCFSLFSNIFSKTVFAIGRKELKWKWADYPFICFHLELKLVSWYRNNFFFCFPEKLIKYINCCLLGEYIWTCHFVSWALVSSFRNESVEFTESLKLLVTRGIPSGMRQCSEQPFSPANLPRTACSSRGLPQLFWMVPATPPGLWTLGRAHWRRSPHFLRLMLTVFFTGLGALSQVILLWVGFL